MDGQQHNYEIVINKEDLLIELSSDDVYFISKQMDKWFKILLDDSYVPVSIARPPVQSPAAPVNLPIDLPIQQQPQETPMPAPQQVAQVMPQPVEPVQNYQQQMPQPYPQQAVQYQQAPNQAPPPPIQPQMHQQDMSQVNLPHEMLSASPAQQQVQRQAPVPNQAPQPAQPMPVQPSAPALSQPEAQYQQQVAQAFQPIAPPPSPELSQQAPAPLPSPQSIHQAVPQVAPQALEPVQRPLLAPETQLQQQAAIQPHQEQVQPQAQAPEYYLPEPETKLEPEQQELATQGPAPTVEKAAEINPVPPEVTDDFERVMDTLMEDLGEENTPAQSKANKGGSTDETNINSLSDLCKKGNASTSEEFMLLSAYYLTYFEAVENFSLKKLNSTMVKSGLTPVNHSVLETALAKGYLSMVPDLTGSMNVTEYALTSEGASKAGLT